MNKKGKIRRLLGHSAANTTSRERTDANLIDYSPKIRPRASQSVAYFAGEEILCFDKSPDGQKVVIAGSGMLKTLRVEGLAVTEDADLRAMIQMRTTTHNTKHPASESYAAITIISVKWLHGLLSNIIIAASTNGILMAYDLNRLGSELEISRIHAHPREIYKLAISPHKPQWLLSASRDGTVKSWSIRSAHGDSSVPYFRHLQTFKCTSEVLDVKWSPTDGLVFACCTDLGQVLKWDLRDPIKPSLRINAHSGQCYSIAWHPNGEHIASGGQDQFCNVWNLSKTAKKNQNASHTLETRAPISCVCWRPAFWSTTANGMRSAQLTITFRDDRKMDALVEIWDLARPTMPFKQLPYKPRPTRKIIDSSLVEQRPELQGLKGTLEDRPPCDEGWDTAPIDILWVNRDLLWTINNTIGTTNSGQSTVREGWFIQSDLAFVPNLIEQRSLSNFAFSATGDVLMILEERQMRQRQKSYPTSPKLSPDLSQDNSGLNLSSAILNDSEEDVFGSFLGHRKKKGLERSCSSRSYQSNITSPNNYGRNGNTMTLEESINVTGIYQPQQVMAIGHAPSAIDGTEYQTYSSVYFIRLLEPPQINQSPNEQIGIVLESFAHIAENLGHFRLAQTWRFLSMSMSFLLIRRYDVHREARLKRLEFSTSIRYESSELPDLTVWPMRNREITLKKTQLDNVFPGLLHDSARDTISEETESTSYFTSPPTQSMNETNSYGTREKLNKPLTEDKKSGYSESPLRISHSATSPTAKDPVALLTTPSAVNLLSHTNPSSIPSDFLHQPDDPLFTLPALDPAIIIKQIIKYYSDTSRLIHIIPMLLLLLPYLPSDTLEPLHASQIISHVHARLNSLQLYIEAALLRNLCVPNYPDIYSESQKNIRIAFFCTACDKPYDPDPRIPNAHWKCPRCKKNMERCPICEQREYILEESESELAYDSTSLDADREKPVLPLSTWWYCPGCAHGGHVACIQEWHGALEPENEQSPLHSRGACPVAGCLHPCLPGSWRDQLKQEKAARAEAKTEHRISARENLRFTGFGGLGSSITTTSHGVAVPVRDTRDFEQSYAVEGVKVTLDDTGKSLGDGRNYLTRRQSGGGRLFSRGGMRESRSH